MSFINWFAERAEERVREAEEELKALREERRMTIKSRIECLKEITQFTRFAIDTLNGREFIDANTYNELNSQLDQVEKELSVEEQKLPENANLDDVSEKLDDVSEKLDDVSENYISEKLHAPYESFFRLIKKIGKKH